MVLFLGCTVDGTMSDIPPDELNFGDGGSGRRDATAPSDTATSPPRTDAGAVPDTRADASTPPRDAPGDVVLGACTGAGATRPECQCTPRTETSCWMGTSTQRDVGICRSGRARCEPVSEEFGRWGPCTGAVLPAMEACDGLDNDCNGTVDDGCECRPGMTRSCYGGPMGTAGVASCRAGTQSCAAGAGGVGARWGACTGEARPQRETCNGLDDDCNGGVDDGIGCTCTPGMSRSCYSGPAATSGVGICRAGMQSCAVDGSRWGTCMGERLPAREVCNMLDDDCNGRTDELPECMPFGVTCPPPATGPAGTPVPLRAVPSQPGASCRWEVTGRPMGAGTEGAFANPEACETTFSSVIVGTYTVRVTATDATGRTASCMTTVTLTGRGLRVEMAWSTTGDVDLHLLHPTGTQWFSSPLDCYYANTRPAWDGGGAQAPGLDVDNVTSFGPENIRIDTPVVGQTYRVGVHAFSRVDAGSMVTVRVYCGSATTPNRTFTRMITSRASDSGNNDFWRVADVRIDSPSTCMITALETVIPASMARTGR